MSDDLPRMHVGPISIYLEDRFLSWICVPRSLRIEVCLFRLRSFYHFYSLLCLPYIVLIVCCWSLSTAWGYLSMIHNHSSTYESPHISRTCTNRPALPAVVSLSESFWRYRIYEEKLIINNCAVMVTYSCLENKSSYLSQLASWQSIDDCSNIYTNVK
jgi:hypothetical protein